jgi:hypothetical protein
MCCQRLSITSFNKVFFTTLPWAKKYQNIETGIYDSVLAILTSLDNVMNAFLGDYYQHYPTILPAYCIRSNRPQDAQVENSGGTYGTATQSWQIIHCN